MSCMVELRKEVGELMKEEESGVVTLADEFIAVLGSVGLLWDGCVIRMQCVFVVGWVRD